MPLSIPVFSQNPEVVLTTGHTDQVNTVDFSKDGRWLATGGNDNNIKLWDVRTAREYRTLAGSDGRIVDVHFTKDSRKIGALNYNEQLRVWECKSGKELFVIDGISSTSESFQFVRNDSLVFFVTNNHEFALADANSGKILIKKKMEWMPMRMVASPDGKWIYALDHTGKLIELSMPDFSEHRSTQLFTTFQYSPARLMVDPTGKWLAAAYDDQTVRIYATAELKEKKVLMGHQSRLVDLCFSSDGKRLFSVDHFGFIRSWDPESGKQLFAMEKKYVSIRRMCMHPFENILAYTAFKDVFYMEAVTGKDLKVFRSKANRVLSMSYDQKGKFLATAYDDLSIKLWDLEKLRITKQLDGFFPVCFNSSGNRLICMSNQIRLKVYDAENGTSIKDLDTDSELIQNLSCSNNDRFVAGAGFLGVIKIWDLESGKMVRKLNGHVNGVYATAWSPDDRFLVSCGMDQTVRVWDMEKGNEIATLSGHEVLVHDVAFSPDGKYFASVAWDKTVRIWETGSWKIWKELKGHINIVTAVTFSGDSKYVISGGGNNVVAPADNSIRVWDVSTGSEVCVFRNPTGQINHLEAERKGNLLFSCSNDGMVKVWDLKKCTEIGSLISANKTDHIIVTPDHYYTASRGAFASVSFRIDDQLFPFEQFDMRLNRPDIVASRIGKTPANLVNAFNYVYRKRLERLNFREEDFGTKFQVPEVFLDRSALVSLTTTEELKFPVKLSDATEKLDRLLVRVNGVPLNGPAGIDLRRYNSRSIDMEVAISLLPGTNHVHVSCVNEKGAESLLHEFEVVRGGASKSNKVYVVAIGVGDYSDDQFDLKYPAKDAKDFISRIRSTNDKTADIRSLLLCDKQVTREALDSIRNFIAAAGSQDVVILFLAGHGVLDVDYNYFFATEDIDFSNPGVRGIAYEQIEKLFALIPAQRKLLIMDTCHSGELDKTELEKEKQVEVEVKNVQFRAVGAGVKQRQMAGGSSTEMMQLLFADVKDQTGTVVISSSGGAEFSMESDEWKNGLFTYCILSAGSDFSADINHDKRISVSELRQYTYLKVEKLSKGLQKPTTRSDNLFLDFYVW